MEEMKKQVKGEGVLVSYSSYLGFGFFMILNLIVIIEFFKYKAGISSFFIESLPLIKILLNIDFLFTLVLLVIYCKLEGFINFGTIYIALLILCLAWGLYNLSIGKPLPMIIMLGIYAIGIAVFTWIIGLGAVLNSKRRKDLT